jgi:hypothetical protein
VYLETKFKRNNLVRREIMQQEDVDSQHNIEILNLYAL